MPGNKEGDQVAVQVVELPALWMLIRRTFLMPMHAKCVTESERDTTVYTLVCHF